MALSGKLAPLTDPAIASQLAVPEMRALVCEALTEICRLVSEATAGCPPTTFFLGDSALGLSSHEVEVALRVDNPAALLHEVRCRCAEVFEGSDVAATSDADGNDDLRCRLRRGSRSRHSMDEKPSCDVVLTIVTRQESLERRVRLHEAQRLLLDLGGVRARQAVQRKNQRPTGGETEGRSAEAEVGADRTSTEALLALYFGMQDDGNAQLRQLAMDPRGILHWRAKTQATQMVADGHREALLLASKHVDVTGKGSCPLSTAESTVHRILAEMESFANMMVAQAQEAGVFDGLVRELDHACYRVESVEEFETLKRYFTALRAGTILSESFIFGRPIASILLAKPIPVAGGRLTVDVLELPAPKPGQFYPTGFEHVEFVVDEPLSALLDRYPHVVFNTQNMHASRNADVLTRFAGKGVVKFHEMSLERVIAIESLDEFCGAARAPRLVVIDLDDTLVSTRPALVESFRLALGDLLRRNVLHDEVAPRMRPTFCEFLHQFSQERQTNADTDGGCVCGDGARGLLVEEFLVFFRRRWREVWKPSEQEAAVPPGIASLLASLRSNGFDIVVWTARDAETAADLLQQYPDIGPHVSKLFAYRPDSAGGGKPVPPQELSDLVRVAACGRAVMIGDSSSDSAGAAALQIPFIEATWLHGSTRAASAAPPSATPCAAAANQRTEVDDDGVPRYSAATPLAALTLVHQLLKRP